MEVSSYQVPVVEQLVVYGLQGASAFAKHLCKGWESKKTEDYLVI